SVGGEDVRIHLRARVTGAGGTEVVRTSEDDPGRTPLLGVQGVGDGRLLRLVVSREGTVEHPPRSEQPPLAVGLHDERIVAGERVLATDARIGSTRRSSVGRKV